MFVTTDTSLTAVPTPRSRMPPRAVSVTATCTLGSASTRAAPPGPDQSPVSTTSPSMTMPSVDDQPGIRPPALTRWAISRVVVVLPLVPVTATTGIVGRNGRTVSSGIVTGHGRRDLARRDDRVDAAGRDGVEGRGDLHPEQLRGPAVAEGVGHHDRVVVAGPGNRRHPGGQGAGRPAHHGRGQFRGGLARVGEWGSPTVGLRTRSARCQATTSAGSAPSTPLRVQRQLDRRPGEIQVRARSAPAVRQVGQGPRRAAASSTLAAAPRPESGVFASVAVRVRRNPKRQVAAASVGPRTGRHRRDGGLRDRRSRSRLRCVRASTGLASDEPPRHRSVPDVARSG